ncbi:MAG: Stp1/IreP family PP2C-type Ser/Thr phosphatase [Deltaproteobacteria bacterium]|nr:Stp1/IreP family PP2C-type Ser/Thr phosphatase [Deltaproteobacteria bacterium]
MSLLRTIAYGESNVGKVREHNEDSFVADAQLGFFMVADGVGGGNAGEVASAMLVELIHEEIATLHESLAARKLPPHEQQEQLHRLMPKMVERASELIYRKAMEDRQLRGMATTAVLLMILGERAIIAHVGDSRLYLMRRGTIFQITQDHSLAREMVEKGLLTEEEIPRFRYKNVILRSIGLQPTVLVDTLTMDILPGDSLLLCSDGLSDLVGRDQLKSIVLGHPPREAVQQLIAAANDGGGSDNITAILVQVLGTPPPEQVMATEQRAAFLSHVFLFEELSFPEMLKVIQCIHEHRVHKGEYVLRQGDDGDRLFLVATGSVEVRQEGVVLTRIGMGGHFGELSLVSSGTHSADVLACEETMLLTISRSEFLELLHADHTLATKLLWRFLLNLGNRVRDLSGQVSRLVREREVGRSRTIPEITKL